ncbi:SDR family NAD(P)-dependent oxidoreductase [Kitasatospora sp. NPDC056327]|uniref:SDR family NAD(P)-dependent oxidoreductase n=1 Tax=Kitasatospora sp. NPDC056327 TaxID=3345785 RepID=UPI0035DF65DE
MSTTSSRPAAPTAAPADTGRETLPGAPAENDAAAPEARLAGANVLITGGSRGLGREMARAFLVHGARVTVTGRDPDALAATRSALAGHGELGTAAADSTDHAALRDLARRLRAEQGGTDVLVVNAALPGPVGPAWENDPVQWWSTQQTNVLGAFLTCHAFVPQLIERRGRIVIIASHAGAHRWPHASAYSVSKAAAIKFAENLAAELHPHGVPVFSYHPGKLTIGMAEIQMTGRPQPGTWPERIQRWYLREHAEGRTTPVEHSVRGVLRLAAGAADHLSGQYLTHDHADLVPGPGRTVPRTPVSGPTVPRTPGQGEPLPGPTTDDDALHP